jgi:hypothetical protein
MNYQAEAFLIVGIKEAAVSNALSKYDFSWLKL